MARTVGALLEHADAVLVANMLGNGVSSSPSTCAAYPPVVTVDDQARALRRACDAAFGPARTVDVAYGYSMGAMQALALARGGGVAAVVAVCGASGCSDYNRVFLDARDQPLVAGSARAGCCCSTSQVQISSIVWRLNFGCASDLTSLGFRVRKAIRDSCRAL